MPLLSEVLIANKNSFDSINNEIDQVFQNALQKIDSFEESMKQPKKVRAIRKETTLQSINEDEDEIPKQIEQMTDNEANGKSEPRRHSKKRNKNEVDGLNSPAQDKRQKRNASIKAQNNITKQVKVNLTQKLRREDAFDKSQNEQPSQENITKADDENKENSTPNTIIQIKQEKISIPRETIAIEIKQVDAKKEIGEDVMAMPPPMAPVPKPRRGVPKEKPAEDVISDVDTTRRPSRSKKVVEMPPPPAASARTLRASTRATRQTNVTADDTASIIEPRPKRTRAKKKELAETESTITTEDVIGSPAEKPRPKRTRRAAATTKVASQQSEEDQTKNPPPKEDIPEPFAQSPILQMKTKKNTEGPVTIVKDVELQKKVEDKIKKDLQKKEESIVKDKKNDKNNTVEDNKDNDGRQQKKNQEELVTTDQNNEIKNNYIVKEISTEKDGQQQTKNEEESRTRAKDGDIKKKDNKEKEITANNDDELPKKNQEESRTRVIDGGAKKKDNIEKEIYINKTCQLQKENQEETKNKEEDISLNVTRVIPKSDSNIAVENLEMDKTMVLPNGIYDHAPHTPEAINNMNETMVLGKCDVNTLDAAHKKVMMDTTVVIDKDPKPTNLTDDDSLLTDDSDTMTPPKQDVPQNQPTSAVKEKVQKFEELASRVTRSVVKTGIPRNDEETQNHTPPDRIIKHALPSETLQKMNNMIFNGKTSSATSSASKPRMNNANGNIRSALPHSHSKSSVINKAKEQAEESLMREKEDARKKKEAILEAKKEHQRRKREEKMAAAAAAREVFNKERKLALETAIKGRMDRQAHADQGKMEKLKEIERKKQELARKVAETEERRKAEEQARQQKLAEEIKKAEALRKKQIEESEATKKEAAMMNKEIERRQKEYLEKHKMKSKYDERTYTPLSKAGCTSSSILGATPAPEPVYMQDGFQYLNSDEEREDDQCNIPEPVWSTSQIRRVQLAIQCEVDRTLIDRLFSVRAQTPDLRELFPGIERSRLKRTSSAVWRTPPSAGRKN